MTPMRTQVDEKFLTLYCDPGEDFGWCIGKGTRLIMAGTTKMWDMADEVEWLLKNGGVEGSQFADEVYWRKGVTLDEIAKVPVGRVVCEDFRIYPWAAKQLSWDRVRTARVIGALTDKCRPARYDLPFILQPASIKKAAQMAGAEELYYRPLHENRHQNDAIQHFVFYVNTELMGKTLPMGNDTPENS